MQQLNFAPVPFRGATLYLVERNSEPYTPMKPIVDGLTLDMVAQRKQNASKWMTKKEKLEEYGKRFIPIED